MLTLRRIHVLAVKHMRRGGFVEEALVGFVPMPRAETLVDDLRRTVIALRQKEGAPFPDPHPDRTRLSNGERASRDAVIDERAAIARERAEERRRRLEDA